MIKKAAIFLFITGMAVINGQEIENNSSKNKLKDKIQNPIADLISVPFQYNIDFGSDIGDIKTLNIQPVVPFKLNDNINFITRTIVPIIDTDLSSGIGNITVGGIFTSANPGKFVWGVGPSLWFPALDKGLRESTSGGEKFGIAPSFVALYQKKGWTLGGIVQNYFGIAGPSDASDLNLFYSQLFVTKSLSNGWYVNTAPIITANWEADSGNEWTIPIGAGAGKLFRLGKLPLNAQLGAYKYIESSINIDWQLRGQIVVILPK